MNEIEIQVEGKIYRLTDLNNGNKYSRAKKDAGQYAKPQQILAYYDRLEGYIQDNNGNKVNNGQFWEEVRKMTETKERRKKNLKQIDEFLKHPIIATVIAALLLAFVYWVVGLIF